MRLAERHNVAHYKFAYGGSVSGSSQFPLPLKKMLNIKNKNGQI
jgi:hypothetical protein